MVQRPWNNMSSILPSHKSPSSIHGPCKSYSIGIRRFRGGRKNACSAPLRQSHRVQMERYIGTRRSSCRNIQQIPPSCICHGIDGHLPESGTLFSRRHRSIRKAHMEHLAVRSCKPTPCHRRILQSPFVCSSDGNEDRDRVRSIEFSHHMARPFHTGIHWSYRKLLENFLVFYTDHNTDVDPWSLSTCCHSWGRHRGGERQREL